MERKRRKRQATWLAVLAVVAMVSGVAWSQTPPLQQDQKKQPAQQQQNPPASNPFPEDTGNVPVLPNGKATAAPEAPNAAGPGADPGAAAALPRTDVDPVRSPDEPVPDSTVNSSGSSSSSAELANILAPPSDEETRKSKKDKGEEPEHTETAKDDENVGAYYLEQKNWRAALSRFQSALVLDPENPDVYWGLAEAQRHLGDNANAKANYMKVMEYDPDSKHAKEAKKVLKEPEMAGAAAPGK